MINFRGRSTHFPNILVFAVASISALSCSTLAQESNRLSQPELRPLNQQLSKLSQTDKRRAATTGPAADTLPDAPVPQDQMQNPSPPSSPFSGTHLNQFPVLPPGLTRISLTVSDKFQIYIHKTYGPSAVILPALGAGLQWANPPSKYPREWKDGAGAFGRNYGYRVADHTARNTAQFLTDVALHEDPRYQRSTSSNPLGRTFHALSFTIFDKTDSGRTTFAFDNVASSAAGGFVGLGILPHGYNDMTHAEQHMAGEFAMLAIGNILTEYEPQWGPWAKKLRIPKILPAWWLPQH